LGIIFSHISFRRGPAEGGATDRRLALLLPEDQIAKAMEKPAKKRKICCMDSMAEVGEVEELGEDKNHKNIAELHISVH